MAHRIPFHREGFTPKTIPGNEQSDLPVRFKLDMAAGPDHARLKSILFACLQTGNPNPRDWSENMQESVIAAFRTGAQVFVNTVRSITNLTAPVAMCRLVGIDVPKDAADEDEIPIRTGAEFARIAPYCLSLALEIAFELQQLTVKGSIDTRFSKPSSGSPATPASPSGSAPAAPTTSGGDGTAASATPPGTPPRLM
jgi:hypothetical protein